MYISFAYFVWQKNSKNLHLDTEKAKEAKLDGREETEEDSPVESAHSSEDSYDWRTRRKTTDIIDSVKKRVAMRSCPSNEQSTESVDEGSAPLPQSDRNLTLDEKLEELVPERKSLSAAAQQCLSLDRNRSLFKSPPTYTTLECMFGPSVSTVSSNSLYSSFRSCDGSILGMRRKLSDHSEKSSPLESADSFESTPNKGAGDDMEQKSSGRRRKCREKSPTRPGFFKSISSPSKIINYVQRHRSNGSSEGSFEENSSHRNGLGSLQNGEERSSSSDSSESPRPNLREVSKSVSYKKSQTPTTSITLSSDDLEIEDQKTCSSELEEIEEALKSPTLKNPFRKRSGAMSLGDDRPRSSSAPNSPCFDLPAEDVQGNTSN